ncbi:MAG: hypothetical protein JSW28_09635 [Thermoplasmata archaeon]|nr:MAG: hypothetical protein JSW28_09635 [Thermoplasmata archaeon]
MGKKSIFTAVTAFLLVLSSNMFVDTGVDVVLEAEAGAVLEVGAGKTYSTIQEAVDAAQPGDTVFVFNGTYNDVNGNWKVDAADIFVVRNGAPGDIIRVINRLTGEVICQFTIVT